MQPLTAYELISQLSGIMDATRKLPTTATRMTPASLRCAADLMQSAILVLGKIDTSYIKEHDIETLNRMADEISRPLRSIQISAQEMLGLTPVRRPTPGVLRAAAAAISGRAEAHNIQVVTCEGATYAVMGDRSYASAHRASM